MGFKVDCFLSRDKPDDDVREGRIEWSKVSPNSR